MKHLLLTASVVAFGAICASHASAQDWQGAYISLTAGFADAGKESEIVNFDTDLDGQYGDTVNTFAGANAFSPGFCDGAATGRTPADGCTEDDSRGGLGLRAGYDWQNGALVYGVVADINSVDISDSVTAFSTTPAAYTFTRKTEALMALRGRVGYAMNDWLFYATAGYARADIERAFATTNGLNSFQATDGDDSDGYQVGLGLEQQIDDRWSMGLEYLRTSLSDEAPTVRAGPSANTFASNPFLIVNPQGTDMQRSEDRLEIDSVFLTVSYRFGAM